MDKINLWMFSNINVSKQNFFTLVNYTECRCVPITFFRVDNGHENISTAFLPHGLIQDEQLSVNSERMYTLYWKTAFERLAQVTVQLG